MKHRMKFNAAAGARNAASVLGALKMANLASMSEEEFAEFLKGLEGGRVFQLLKAGGALAVSEFPSARYAARKYAGCHLKASAGDLPELADGAGDLVALVQRVGQENFERCFLRDAAMSDIERAEECDITVKDAERLRHFVNRAFIQAEFEDGPAELPAAAVYSAVAGISLKDGKPELAFFNREIWKGRYKVDSLKLSKMLPGMSAEEREKVERLLKKMEFADKRKTTLYRALGLLLEAQAEYLRTGDPGRRRPYAQKELAGELEVHPSVLNRLVSNKSVEMPWGLQAPMAALLPTAKRVNLERLYAIAAERPELGDEALAAEMKARYGVELSRRSIAQYRQDLKLAAAGRRKAGD